MSHEAGAEYDGPVTVVSGGAEVVLDARLRGAFQPIDGRFHWYGRLGATDALTSGDPVTLRTEHGQAQGRLSDLDPWGRLRITGTGHPPF